MVETLLIDISGVIFMTGMVVSFLCAAWAIPALALWLAWDWWKRKRRGEA